MFAYITGEVAYIGNLTEGGAQMVVECGGIGWQMSVSTNTAARFRRGETAKVFTHFQAGESGVFLFGFGDAEEKDMFQILTGVSGVGPKAALGLLSAHTPAKIALAIVTDDTTALSKAPGVGKKTAQRIAMELKEKIKGFDATADMAATKQQSLPNQTVSGDTRQEAVEALVALGYQRGDSVRAVLEAAAPGVTTEELIKAGLKKLAAF